MIDQSMLWATNIYLKIFRDVCFNAFFKRKTQPVTSYLLILKWGFFLMSLYLVLSVFCLVAAICGLQTHEVESCCKFILTTIITTLDNIYWIQVNWLPSLKKRLFFPIIHLPQQLWRYPYNHFTHKNIWVLPLW